MMAKSIVPGGVPGAGLLWFLALSGDGDFGVGTAEGEIARIVWEHSKP